MICGFQFSGVHWSDAEDKKMVVRNANELLLSLLAFPMKCDENDWYSKSL